MTVAIVFGGRRLARWVSRGSIRAFVESRSYPYGHAHAARLRSRSVVTTCNGSGEVRRLTEVFAKSGFDDAGLDPRLLRGICAAVAAESQTARDSAPLRMTHVQALAVPALLRSVGDASSPHPDVLLRAHTGTGKTLAFLIPIVERFLRAQFAAKQRESSQAPKSGVLALLVAPTRELVLQLARVARSLVLHCDGAIRVSFLAGGFTMRDDIERLKADCPHILVATPGRLVQHLQGTPNFIQALGSVEVVVLDEADRLLDHNFVHQVDYVVRCLPARPRPQTVLCSATFGDIVRRFARRTLRANLLTLDTAAVSSSSGSDTADFSQSMPSKDVGEVVDKVDQLLVRYRPDALFGTLWHILHAELSQSADVSTSDVNASVGSMSNGPEQSPRRRVLVLFPTVRWLQFVYVMFKHQGGLRNVWAMHGQLPDDKRRARAALFSRGSPVQGPGGVLFATDVAARGLDLDVDAVVQVGPPTDREQYVHRAGRTGRLAAQGRSVLLLNALEESSVLLDLAGVGVRDAPPGLYGGIGSDGNAHDAVVLAPPPPSVLLGWWDEPPLVSSSKLFFASVIVFYFERRALFGASTEDVVRLASDFLVSTGLARGQSTRGGASAMPPLAPGLAKRLLAEDPMCGVRAESVRQRWDLLCALPGHPGFRSRAAAAAGPDAQACLRKAAESGSEDDVDLLRT